MNQINTDLEFLAVQPVSAAPLAPPGAAAAAAKAPAPPDRPAPRPAPARTLSEADIRAVYTALTQGEDPLARRKDLGELHKRIVTMLTTVQQGLGEAQARQIAADRTATVARLDQMERALNSMEGALRIELEPMLRATVEDIAAQTIRPAKLSFWRLLIIAIAGTALIAIGAAYSKPLQAIAITGTTTFLNSLNSAKIVLSPNGGISEPANHVD